MMFLIFMLFSCDFLPFHVNSLEAARKYTVGTWHGEKMDEEGKLYKHRVIFSEDGACEYRSLSAYDLTTYGWRSAVLLEGTWSPGRIVIKKSGLEYFYAEAQMMNNGEKETSVFIYNRSIGFRDYLVLTLGSSSISFKKKLLD